MRQFVMIIVPVTWYQTDEAIHQAEAFHNQCRILYKNHGSGQIEVRAKRNRIRDVYAVIKTEPLLMTVEYGNENFDDASSQRLQFLIDPPS